MPPCHKFRMVLAALLLSVVEHPLARFGLIDFWQTLRRIRSETMIAVNIGGCIIPMSLAAYEVFHVSKSSSQAILAVALAVTIKVTFCYFVARSTPNVGVVMPAFLPTAAAAASAYLLFPRLTPPIAIVAGVMGLIIAADLLHIKEFTRTTRGVASIGGAGTFDGMILYGILAAYPA
jgi:uncharacterized membrane protein